MSPVTIQMETLIGRWEEEHDNRAIFLNCYLLMTRNMLQALDAAEFHDPLWVSRLLELFADYYFSALAAYEAHTNAPAAWHIAHHAAQGTEAAVLQKLLLGINAHINYDLVLTLVDMLHEEWPSLTADQRQQRYEDHTHVNTIIQRTTDLVQEEVVRRHAPLMAWVDALMGPVDEWLADLLITDWRDDVWGQAIHFLEHNPPTADRTALRATLETAAMHRAHQILLGRAG